MLVDRLVNVNLDVHDKVGFVDAGTAHVRVTVGGKVNK